MRGQIGDKDQHFFSLSKASAARRRRGAAASETTNAHSQVNKTITEIKHLQLRSPVRSFPGPLEREEFVVLQRRPRPGSPLDEGRLRLDKDAVRSGGLGVLEGPGSGKRSVMVLKKIPGRERSL